MSRPARAVCVLLMLLVVVSGCGGKSKSTAYPVPPPAPPGEDKPSAEVSQNLALALGPAASRPETLEERRAKLPSALVGDKGNAVYSGERLMGSVTGRATAAAPAAGSASVPPAPAIPKAPPAVAKAPPAVPRIPVERQSASATPPAAPPAAPPAPANAAPAPPAAEPPRPAPPAPTANLSGGGLVTAQLGAFRTRANAEGGWQRLRAAHPDQLGDRALILQERDLGERGIFYRVRTGPFTDLAAAKAFCEQLKIRDQGCVVISPE